MTNAYNSATTERAVAARHLAASQEGRKAAREGQPFAPPYFTMGLRRAWEAGYRSEKPSAEPPEAVKDDDYYFAFDRGRRAAHKGDTYDSGLFTDSHFTVGWMAGWTAGKKERPHNISSTDLEAANDKS